MLYVKNYLYCSVVLAATLLSCKQTQPLFESLPVEKSTKSYDVLLDSAHNDNMPEVKLLIVPDNSASMLSSQQKLSDNSLSLATGLRGKNAKVTIVTTAGLDIDSATVHNPSFTQTTVYDRLDGSGNVLSTQTTAPTTGDYRKRVVRSLAAAQGSTDIEFKTTMSTQEFNDARDAMAAAIINVGVDLSANGGTQASHEVNEAPLCTIGRALTDSQYIETGDKFASLVLTDTKDFSIGATSVTGSGDARYLCNTEENQKYKFQAGSSNGVSVPVAATVPTAEFYRYSANFKAPDTYSVTYKYATGSGYTLEAKYNEFRVYASYKTPTYTYSGTYTTPVYTVYHKQYKPQYKASFTYNYNAAGCGPDGNVGPCPAYTGTNVLFAPASMGVVAAGETNVAATTCPTALANFLITNGGKPAGGTMTCNYTYTSNLKTPSATLNAVQSVGVSTSSGSQTCPTSNTSFTSSFNSLLDSANNYTSLLCSTQYVANSGTISSTTFTPDNTNGVTTQVPGTPMAAAVSCPNSLRTVVAATTSSVPAGSILDTCNYIYTEPLTTPTSGSFVQVFNPNSYSGVNINTAVGNTNTCPASVIALAQSLITTGKIYNDCNFKVISMTKTKNTLQGFNAATYGVPSGTGVLCSSFSAQLITDAPTITGIPSTGIYQPTTCKTTSAITESSSINLSPAITSPNGMTANGSCLANTAIIALVNAQKTAQNQTGATSVCTYTATTGASTACSGFDDSTGNLAIDQCSTNTGAAVQLAFTGNPSLYCGSPSALTGKVYQSGSCSKAPYKMSTVVYASDTYIPEGPNLKTSVLSALSGEVIDNTNYVSAIQNHADLNYGQKGWYIGAVAAELPNCTPSSDSNGLGAIELRQLIDFRPLGFGSMHPICANSYDPALDGLNAFVESISIGSYEFKLKPGERIKEVKVGKNPESLHIVPTGSYIYKDELLEFSPGVITKGNVIAITLEKDVYTQGGDEVPEGGYTEGQ